MGKRYWLAAAGGPAASGGAGRGKCLDPDLPAVQAAARAALPHAKVLDIVGITTGIQSVLQDLGAKVTAQEVKIELNADVLFDFDKYNLKPEATESLKKVGQVLQSYPN